MEETIISEITKVDDAEKQAAAGDDIISGSSNDIIVTEKKNKVPIAEVDKKTAEVMTLDFSGVKDIRKDKYNSTALINPKSQAVKDRYFKMYEDYVTSHLTMGDLAEKYKIQIYQAGKIIKWVTFQIGDTDPDAALQVMVDNLKKRKQKVTGLLAECNSIKEKIKVYRTLTSIDKVLAKVEGLMSDSLIDMSDRRQINVKMNEGLARRTGGGRIKNKGPVEEETGEDVGPAEDVEINNDEGVVLMGDVKRRGGE